MRHAAFLAAFLTAFTLLTHIINGQESAVSERPYLCAVSRKTASAWYVVCHGVIYNKNSILTVAHCVQGISADDLRVTCGLHNLYDPGAHAQIRNVTKVKVHPGFNYFKNKTEDVNDIVLLRLSLSLTFNSMVRSIPVLEYQERDLPGKCQIVGWGENETGEFDPAVRMTDVKWLKQTMCRKTPGYGWLSRKQGCFLDHSVGNVGCNADAGAPAVCDGLLVGLLSWKPQNCDGNPAVFTRVHKYRLWLKSNSWK